MPSRLSSLLVRDGLVGVKRMEKAFQRQVIYGGTLDTILLEMSLVPEERLTQYLALASGLPPAARDEGSVVQPAAVELVSRELAEKYRAVPLAIAHTASPSGGADGEALRVLVCAPLEMSELEDFADLLDRPLQPLITPEYRWHLVYAAAYALDPPARFTTLARALDVDAPTAPVGRGTSVIVDERAPAPAAVAAAAAPAVPAAAVAPAAPVASAEPVAAPAPEPPANAVPSLAPIAHDDITLKMAAVDLPEPDDGGRRHRATMLGVAPNRAVTEPSAETPAEPGLPFALTMVEPTASRRAAAVPIRRIKKLLRAESPPVEELGKDSPLPIVRARELLAIAGDRDVAFLTLLRAARSRARYAGLLTVQGGAAIGRVALAESGIDTAGIASVSIALDAPSPFRTVVTNQQPHVGPITSGDPAIDQMTRRFGGTTPTSALLLPIVLRGRTVAIVVAHRLIHDIKLVDITELLPLASATSDALSRLIVKHKAAGYRAPDASAPVVAIEADQIDTKNVTRDASPWRTPAEHVEPPVVPAFGDAVPRAIGARPRRSTPCSTTSSAHPSPARRPRSPRPSSARPRRSAR